LVAVGIELAPFTHIDRAIASLGAHDSDWRRFNRAMTFTTGGTSAYARHVGRYRLWLSAARADAAVDRPVAVGDVDAGDLDVALSA
jgi:hypothetical protein